MAIDVNVYLKSAEKNTKDLKTQGASNEIVILSKQIEALIKAVYDLRSSIVEKIGIVSKAGYKAEDVKGIADNIKQLSDVANTLDKTTDALVKGSRSAPERTIPALKRTEETARKASAQAKTEMVAPMGDVQLKLDFGDTADVIAKKVAKGVEEATQKSISELSKTLDSGTNKLAMTMSRSDTTLQKSTAAMNSAIAAYNSYTIKPVQFGGQRKEVELYSGRKEDKLVRQTEDRINELNNSLYKLQKTIYESAQKALAPIGKQAEIMPVSNAPFPFQLAAGAREWEMQIVNVKKLRDEVYDTIKKLEMSKDSLKKIGIAVDDVAASGASHLRDMFKKAYVATQFEQAKGAPDKMAQDIDKWLARLNVAPAGDQIVTSIHKAFKQGTVRSISQVELAPGKMEQIYKEMVLPEQALRKFREEFVKSITVPAMRLTQQGNVEFETRTGSAKTAAEFGTLSTGLEKMVNRFASKDERFYRSLKMEVESLPIRPEVKRSGQSAEDFSKQMNRVNTVAGTLIENLSKSGKKEDIDLLSTGYKRAIALRATERISDPEKAKATAKEYLEMNRSLDDLRITAEKVGVSFYDVAKALNSINFDNFYDLLEKKYTVQGRGITSQLSSFRSLEKSDKAFREIAKVKDTLMEYMPQVPAGQPKRSSYNQAVVTLATRGFVDIEETASGGKYAKAKKLTQEEQKQHIIDVNLISKEIDDMNRAIGDSALQSVRLYTNAISDAASSVFKEAAGNKYLLTLGREEIRAQAPFKEYSSAARQQSYVSSAYTGPGFTRPNIVSTMEEAYIKAGKYGTPRPGEKLTRPSEVGASGYGHMPVVQMLNTAATFEDQILVDAGSKIANAFVEVVKPSLYPATDIEKSIKPLEPGLKNLTAATKNYPKLLASEIGTEDFSKAVKEVSKRIQDVMGVETVYEGRADIAKLEEEIATVVKESGGKTIEAQAAKVTEIFLNYFGRKFATRAGTKGVSMTTKAGGMDKDVLNLFGMGKEIKLTEERGSLGYVKKLKDIGQLAAEIIENTFSDENSKALADQLRTSGNKFIISLFTDAEKGLVVPEEAQKNIDLQQRAFEALGKAGVSGLGQDVTGIETIKKAYKEMLPGKEMFEAIPVDVRISSRGMAKRGLMTEPLTAMTQQLAGWGMEGRTVLKDMPENVLSMTKESRSEMKALHEALGYSQFKDIGKLEKNIKFEGSKLKPEDIEALKKWESEFSVYLDTINEYGERTQTFTSPMFLQDIDPMQRYKEKPTGEIEEGVIKLNPQAMAAYFAQYGRDSEILRDILSNATNVSRENWEALKAFVMVQSEHQKTLANNLKSLKTVGLGELGLQAFEKRTAAPEDIKGGLFDISKYPAAFKVKVPTGLSAGPNPEIERKELYIPGPALRQTYKDPLTGEQALTDVSRALRNYLDAAREVEDRIRSGVGGSTDIGKTAENIKRALSSLEASAVSGKGVDQQTLGRKINSLIEVIGGIDRIGGRPGVEVSAKLQGMVGEGRRPADIIRAIRDVVVGTQKGVAEKNLTVLQKMYDVQKEMGGRGASNSDIIKAINAIDVEAFGKTTLSKKINAGKVENIGGYLADSIRAEKRKTSFRGILSEELDPNVISGFASALETEIAKSVSEGVLKGLESLKYAEKQYYEALGKNLFGKKAGIESIFYSRKVPSSVMARATVGIADKVEDFQNAISALNEVGGMEDIVSNIEKLKTEHAQKLSMAKKRGIPVLGEREVGISEHLARQLKLKDEAGKEYNLAKYITEKGPAPVSTVRYPFTGASSIQGFHGKLLEDSLTGPNKYTVTVPGVPELDMAALKDITDKLKETATEKISAREELWKTADTATTTEEQLKAADAAMQLTKEIEIVIEALRSLTPKYHSMEQKLDFDGDTIYLHTASVKKARDEIEKQIGMMDADTEKLTSVRSLFNTIFTAYKEGSGQTLAEQAVVFGKRHPEEKGFKFLEQPYLKEQVENIKDISKVVEGLYSYAEGKPSKLEFGKDEESYNRAMMEHRKSFEESLMGEVQSEAGRKAGGARDTKSVEALVDKLLREKLYEKRLADAIQGQLYKIDTGMTVEGIRRLAGVTELETGFGTGVAGTGKGGMAPSSEFLKYWPEESAVLGKKPVEEFQTRMQELMRFVIQKGMDVKHAGTKSVASEVFNRIGKAGGSEELYKYMQENESMFDELLDFDKQIAESVKLRMGKLPTKKIAEELNMFLKGAGEELVDVSGKLDRESLIKRIVDRVNLKATFEEIFRQLERQAVEGMTSQTVKQFKELRMSLKDTYEKFGGASPEYKDVGKKYEAFTKKVGIEKGFSREDILNKIVEYAKYVVSSEAMGDEGINPITHIVEAKTPLYQLRTSSMRDVTSVANSRLSMREFGGVAAPGMESVEKAAYITQSAVQQAYRDTSRGIAGELTRSTIENRLREIDLLKSAVAGAEKPAELRMDKTDISIPSSKLAEDIWGTAVRRTAMGGDFPTSETTTQEAMRNAKKANTVRIREAERIMKDFMGTVGIPTMKPEEIEDIFYQKSENDPEVMKAFKAISGVAEKSRGIALRRGATEEEADQYVNTLIELHENTLKYFVALNEQIRRMKEASEDLGFEESYVKFLVGGAGGGNEPPGGKSFGSILPMDNLKSYVDALSSLKGVSFDFGNIDIKDPRNFEKAVEIIKTVAEMAKKVPIENLNIQASSEADLRDQLGYSGKGLVRGTYTTSGAGEPGLISFNKELITEPSMFKSAFETFGGAGASTPTIAGAEDSPIGTTIQHEIFHYLQEMLDKYAKNNDDEIAQLYIRIKDLYEMIAKTKNVGAAPSLYSLKGGEDVFAEAGVEYINSGSLDKLSESAQLMGRLLDMLKNRKAGGARKGVYGSIDTGAPYYDFMSHDIPADEEYPSFDDNPEFEKFLDEQRSKLRDIDIENMPLFEEAAKERKYAPSYTNKEITALRDELERISSALTGGVNKMEDLPLYKLFRASSLQRGGGFARVGAGGVKPGSLEAIIKSMLKKTKPSVLLEASSFRGSAIHEDIQKEYEEKYGAQTEGIVEDLVNNITGHYDLLYSKEGVPTVGDIKTIYSENKFSKLEAIAKQISAGKYGNVREYLASKSPKELQSDDVLRKLQDYIGQINFYLGNINTEAGKGFATDIEGRKVFGSELPTDKVFPKNIQGEIIAVSQHDPSKRVNLPIGGFDPEEYKQAIDDLKRAREVVDKILSASSSEEVRSILEDFPNVLKELSNMDLSPEAIKKHLPKTANLENVRKAAESAKQYQSSAVFTDEIKRFKEYGAQYLELLDYWQSAGINISNSLEEILSSGAPGIAAAAGGAGGMPPAGGGGGFDDDDELLNKMKALVKTISEKGIQQTIPEREELVGLMDELSDRILHASEDQKTEYKTLLNQAEQTLGGPEGVSYTRQLRASETMRRRVESEPLGGRGFGYGGGAEPKFTDLGNPATLHKNLLALYQRAAEYWNFDEDKFDSDIKKLIKESEEQGPKLEITQKISEALESRGEEGGKLLVPVWRHYRNAINKFFINRLDAIQQELADAEEQGMEGAVASLSAQYESTVRRWQKYIKDALPRATDIYTVKSGSSREFISPDIALASGLYKTPQELTELERQRLPENLRPLLSDITGDLDVSNIDNMTSAIEKVRSVFEGLSRVDPEFRRIAGDADLFRRKGAEVVDAWDVKPILKDITALRGALESYHRLRIERRGGEGDDYTEAMRKNVEVTIGMLKRMENELYKSQGSKFELFPVPKELGFDQQIELHKRNIAKLRQYFRQAAEEGGAAIGEAFNYKERIVDPTGQVIKNTIHEFRKIGQTDTGRGVFTEERDDLIKSWQGRKGIGQAFRRVALWGTASTVVWQSVDALKSMVQTITEVEMKMADLRQVMNPLTTDFGVMQSAAVQFAEEYGQSVERILDGMRIFAQQGLAQAEVLDRTRAAALAANVTTLNAKDATEALTAATRVYGQEGESAVRFLDAWSQVEARHAVTSGNLADAMKKAGSAAKTAGFSFHELNAIVTGIGETTRQTGKEIGTSVRFIARRLYGEESAKSLQSVGVVPTLETGEIRGGFDVLDELARKWDTLTKAQQLNIAMAVGGTRHYNSVIVLMDHWKDVLSTLTDSINSKGTAERRNAIVMETYAKKVEQLRAAMTDLQLEFGKVALPFAKATVDSLRYLVKLVAEVPTSVKVAFAAFAGFFTILSKGQGIFNTISDGIISIENAFSRFGESGLKDIRVGIFEIFGKGLGGINTEGLKTLTEATGIQDFESDLGQMGYLFAKYGRSFNQFLAELLLGATAASGTLSGIFDVVGEKMFSASKFLTTKGQLEASAVTAAGALAAESGEKISKKFAEAFGKGAAGIADWAGPQSSFIKSIAPVAIATAALIPTVKALAEGWRRLSSSAVDYEKSMEGVRRTNFEELSQLKDLKTFISSYSKTASEMRDTLSDPAAAQFKIERGEYTSPLLEASKYIEEINIKSTQIASKYPELVSGFDEYGNAILKSNKSLEEHVNLLNSIKVREILEDELDIIDKFTEDLTDTGWTEEFKAQLKTLFKETPGLSVFADQISVAPAKELEKELEKVRKLQEIKMANPFAPVDESLKKHTGTLADVQNRYRDTYKQARAALSGLSTEGLNEEEIQELFNKEALNKLYEVVVNFEIKPMLAFSKESLGFDIGDVTAADVRGSEILKRVAGEIGGSYIDFTGVLTRERFRTAQIMARENEAFNNDVVIFNKSLADSMGIAGAQGILEVTDEGAFVKVVDRLTGAIKRINWEDSQVRDAAESIFPVTSIKETLSENIESLQEYVVGAASGLTSIIDNKVFRKDIGLGARFFSQIPTESLIQTSRGYNPATGAFGQVPYKQDFPQMFDKFIKSFENLKTYLQPTEALEAADQSSTLSVGVKQDIERYKVLVRNNQIALQFAATMEEFAKSAEESNRALERSIMVERERAKFVTQTSGLLAGLPEQIQTIDFGKRTTEQLTDQEKLLYGERNLPPDQRKFTQLTEAYRENDIRRRSINAQRDALVELESNMRALTKMYGGEGFGEILSPDQLKDYLQYTTVADTRGQALDITIQKQQLKTQEEIRDAIVKQLDQTSPIEAIRSEVGKIGSGAASGSVQDILKAMRELIVGRIKYSEAGRLDAVGVINAELTKLSAALIETSGGAEKAYKTMEAAFGGTFGRASNKAARFDSVDVLMRGLSERVGGPKGFIDIIAERQKELSEIRRQTAYKPETFASAKYARAGYEYGGGSIIGAAAGYGYGNIKDFFGRIEAERNAEALAREKGLITETPLVSPAGSSIMKGLETAVTGLKAVILQRPKDIDELYRTLKTSFSGRGDIKTYQQALTGEQIRAFSAALQRPEPDLETGKFLQKTLGGVAGFMDILRRNMGRQLRAVEMVISSRERERGGIVEEYRTGGITEGVRDQRIKLIDDELQGLKEEKDRIQNIYNERLISELSISGGIVAKTMAQQIAPGLEKYIDYLGEGAIGTILGAYGTAVVTKKDVPEVYSDLLGEFKKAQEAGIAAGKGFKEKYEEKFGTKATEKLADTMKKAKEYVSAEQKRREAEGPVGEQATRDIKAAILEAGGGIDISRLLDVAKKAKEDAGKQMNVDEKALSEQQRQTVLLASIDDSLSGGLFSGAEGRKVLGAVVPEEGTAVDERAALIQATKEAVYGGERQRAAERGLKDVFLDVAAPLLGIGAAGYTFEVSKFGKELEILNDRTAEVRRTFEELIKTPEGWSLIEDMLKLDAARAKQAELGTGATTVMVGNEAIDIEETTQSFMNAIREFRSKLEIESGKVDTEKARIVGEAWSEKISKEIVSSIEMLYKNVQSEMTNFRFGLQYERAVSGPMKGLAAFPERQLPTAMQDLSPTQRMWRMGNLNPNMSYIRDMMLAEQDYSTRRTRSQTSMRELLPQIESTRTNIEESRGRLGDIREVVRNYNDIITARAQEYVNKSTKVYEDTFKDLESYHISPEAASKGYSFAGNVDEAVRDAFKVGQEETEKQLQILSDVESGKLRPYNIKELIGRGRSVAERTGASQEVVDSIDALSERLQVLTKIPERPTFNEWNRLDRTIMETDATGAIDELNRLIAKREALPGFTVDKKTPVFQGYGAKEGTFEYKAFGQLDAAQQNLDYFRDQLVEEARMLAMAPDKVISQLEYLLKFGTEKSEMLSKFELSRTLPEEQVGFDVNEDVWTRYKAAQEGTVDAADSHVKELMREIENYRQLTEQEKALIQQYDAQRRITDDATKAFEKLNNALNVIQSVTGLITQMEKLSVSFKTARESANYSTEAFDKMLGGGHPEARVAPTLEAIRGAKQAGLSEEEISRLNKYEVAKYTKLGTINPETGGYNKWTARDEQEQQVQKAIDQLVYEQQKADRSLTEQKNYVQQLRDAAIETRTQLELTQGPNAPGVKEINNIVKDLANRLSSAAVVEGDQYKGFGNLDDIRQALSKFVVDFKGTDVGQQAQTYAEAVKGTFDSGSDKIVEAMIANTSATVRAMIEVRNAIEEGKPINADEIIKNVAQNQRKDIATFKDYLPEELGTLKEGQPSKDVMLRAAKDVASLYTEKPTETVGMDSVANKFSTAVDVFAKAASELGKFTGVSLPVISTTDVPPPELKAAGGVIRGAGGPTEDKIATSLPIGSYVIKTASARKLGYGNLSNMLGGFAAGGEVPVFLSNGEFVFDPTTAGIIGKGNLDYMNLNGNMPLGFKMGGRLGGGIGSKLNKLFVVGGDPSKIPGLLEKGNIDLMERAKVAVPDIDKNGELLGYSSIRSMSFYSDKDKADVLVPTVIQDPRTGKYKIVSDEEAIKDYFRTGNHLGKFKDPETATDYSIKAHKQQESMGNYASGGEVPWYKRDLLAEGLGWVKGQFGETNKRLTKARLKAIEEKTDIIFGENGRSALDPLKAQAKSAEIAGLTGLHFAVKVGEMVPGAVGMIKEASEAGPKIDVGGMKINPLDNIPLAKMYYYAAEKGYDVGTYIGNLIKDKREREALKESLKESTLTGELPLAVAAAAFTAAAGGPKAGPKIPTALEAAPSLVGREAAMLGREAAAASKAATKIGAGTPGEFYASTRAFEFESPFASAARQGIPRTSEPGMIDIATTARYRRTGSSFAMHHGEFGMTSGLKGTMGSTVKSVGTRYVPGTGPMEVTGPLGLKRVGGPDITSAEGVLGLKRVGGPEIRGAEGALGLKRVGGPEITPAEGALGLKRIGTGAPTEAPAVFQKTTGNVYTRGMKPAGELPEPFKTGTGRIFERGKTSYTVEGSAQSRTGRIYERGKTPTIETPDIFQKKTGRIFQRTDDPSQALIDKLIAGKLPEGLSPESIDRVRQLAKDIIIKNKELNTAIKSGVNSDKLISPQRLADQALADFNSYLKNISDKPNVGGSAFKGTEGSSVFKPEILEGEGSLHSNIQLTKKRIAAAEEMSKTLEAARKMREFRTDLRFTTGNFKEGGQIVGNKVGNALTNVLSRVVPQYKTGTSYVPKNQLAFVHKGEAIIPEKFNKGGAVQALKDGGAVRSQGELIVKLEKDTVRLENDTVKIDSTSISSLEQAISGLTNSIDSRGVGASKNVQRDIDVIAASVADVEGELEKILQNDITELRTKIEEGMDKEQVKNELREEFSSSISSLNDNINSMESNVNGLTDTVNQLQNEVVAREKVNGADVTGLVSKIKKDILDEMDPVINALSRAIDSLSNGLTSLNKTVTVDHEDKLNTTLNLIHIM